MYAIPGQAPIHLADEKRFQQTAKTQVDFLNESFLKVGFDAFGTNIVSDMVNIRGGYPSRNWQSGTFDLIDQVISDIENEARIDAVRKEVNRMMADFPLFAY